MSGHADTIPSDGEVVLEAIAALDALVVENQQQDDRIKWLEGEEAGWRTGTLAQTERLGKATEENQQLRDALDGLLDVANRARSGERVQAVEWYAATDLARAALAGTSSEDTE